MCDPIYPAPPIIKILLLFFFNYSLYGMIPFNISRSNSIMIMGYLKANTGNPKTEIEIEEFVKLKYFKEYGAIQKRLKEQELAGNIIRKGDSYLITPRGSLLITAFGEITDLFKMKNNFAKINTPP
jgi:predicted transcriptional regulator